ncbi:MAG: A/G-specific adenine glycosylase [Thermoflexales bacterium]|nr:A/G-specific adenine glycosylase [Thermoflexales bacterium]
MRRLLAWFEANRRDLPWRREPRDPYAVWMSEAMLQQTQVATVMPYFERWMRRFPDVRALAAAPLDDVLKAWEGLGYYARARNLHRAAQTIVAQGGRLPETVDGLCALPGIGRYTAGAIASLAFNRDAPALDGNVKRVLARLFALGEDWAGWQPPIDLSLGPRGRTRDDLLWALDSALLPAGRAGAFNEAMMELGATRCSPRAPDCPGCPLRTVCAAHAGGSPEAYPVSAPRAALPRRLVVTAVLRDRDGRALMGQRPSRGLLGGLWEFVGSAPLPTEALSAEEAASALEATLAQRTGLRIAVQAADFRAETQHTYTHFRQLRRIAFLRVDASAPALSGDGSYAQLRWVSDAERAALALARNDHRVAALDAPSAAAAGENDLGHARLKRDGDAIDVSG